MIKIFDLPKRIGTTGVAYKVDFTLKSFVDFIDELVKLDGLDLNPDFQRGHVWTKEQQVAYIEFLLSGGHTGKEFYLNHPNWRHLAKKSNYTDVVIVDGLQRLTAIRAFLADEFTIFNDLNDCKGYKASEIDRLNSLGSPHVTLIINDLQTRELVLRWYIEFNAGGTPHSLEEIERVKNLLEQERAK